MRKVSAIPDSNRARRDVIADALKRDTRYAIRRLVRDWRFTAAAVLILGLGIGANTAIFSLLDSTLFRRQAFADSDRLVDIYQNAVNPGGLDANSYPAFLDIASYTDVFATAAASFVPHGVTYLDEGALRPAIAEHTTAGYLAVRGLRPALGRWFTEDEDRRGAAIVAVIGYQAWATKFHADPFVVGRTVPIEGIPVTIVGVGPSGHNSTVNIGIVTDFWLPISSLAALGAPATVLDRRPEEAAFFIKARLRDGVTVAQARAAMQILGGRLAADYPKEDPGKGIAVFAARDVRIHPQMDAALRWAAVALLGVVGLVLAIACSNLATLLLVRGAARAKEVSVRLALGATRGQLVRHLVVESLLIAAAGGVAGLLIAWWTARWLGSLELPIAVNQGLDGRILLFALGLSIMTGLGCGLAPALKATRIDLVPALRDDGETRTAGKVGLTLKNALVVFQVAVSVVLLGGTGIFVRMLSDSRTQQIGFATDGVAMIQTDTRYGGHSTPTEDKVLDDVRRRVSLRPGVEAAAVTRGLPMQVTSMAVVIDGLGDDTTVRAGAIWAGPGFFDALSIPILLGRAIDDRDRSDMPRVAVVSEAMARRYFGGMNAVGRRFRFEKETGGWFEVIGVARDTRTADLQSDLLDPARHLFYRSFSQAGAVPDTLVARAALDASVLASSLQRELRAVDATLPIITVRTMSQYLEDSLLAPKAVAAFLGALGLLGLGLAGIGLYAVVAFTVSCRSREIGIRMALGARRLQVLWTVIKEVAALVTAGTGLGLAGSSLATLILRAVGTPAPGISLYRPSADPLALLLIAAFMAAVALAASSVPAWRATRIDPLKALKRD